MSRIAMLLPDLEVGGAQRVMLLLAKEFAKRGYEVQLIVLSASGPLRDSIPSGVKLIDLGAKKYGLGLLGFTISSVLRLAAWLKCAQPDVLLSSINGANLTALLARKLCRMKVRLVVREAAAVATTAKGLRLRAMRWLYPQADAIVTLSSIMSEDLVNLIGVSRSQIHCIVNPVDVHYVRQQSLLPLNHPWLENKQLKVVISVGRLIPEKDYVTLLKAFALLPTELNARLIVVGEGPERGELELLANNLEISTLVQLVGFDANPWRWMARADLFVLSSVSEGCPNALLESLAVGIPLIATEYDSSIRELAVHHGFEVVPVGEKTVLAQAIEDQLDVEKNNKHKFIDGAGDVVAAYLGTLGCIDSSLSGTTLDHKAASTAK